MENLQPFKGPFNEDTPPEPKPITHSSPPLPPKMSPASRRGVVSMIEKASDFKSTAKSPRVVSGASWISQDNLMEQKPPPPAKSMGSLLEGLPPPKPCDGESTASPLMAGKMGDCG